ncbi:MAG: prepilin-type N-terminal cleavage/methylation domain-containing protein [Planctomycetia bacterium]|nr:prepilin-type N-terminal cleavage/methylation domain-containing protein [Planctomycetia bacterium]
MMRYRSTTTDRRKGLTLVEMMIALALSIFIMAILSEAFITGLNAFGNFKALADLDQRLRTAANIIRRDLKAPHFDGSRKLSECTVSGRPMPMLDGLTGLPAANGMLTAAQATALHRQLSQYRFKSPLEGFFSIEEWPNRPVGATMVFEGQDSSGRPSYRDQPSVDSTGNIVNFSDVLHFTSRLEGNEPDKFFFGRIRGDVLPGFPSPLQNIGLSGGSTRYGSPGLYTSQAAELLYFLGLDGTERLPGVTIAGGPVLTFNLYRQTYLLVPDRFSNGAQPPDDTYYGNNADNYFNGVVASPTLTVSGNDVSAHPTTTPSMAFNTMGSIQHRLNRRGSLSFRMPKHLPSLPAALEGSDLMLTNVISFDVKVFDPFAYKIPVNALNLNPSLPTHGPLTGRGAYVDIGDVLGTTVPGGVNPHPTAAGLPADGLQPLFGGPLNPAPGSEPVGFFDTGTLRFEGPPGGTTLRPQDTPATHAYPFPSIQITIRVFEPKSRQTRQITIIQDM